MKKVLLCSRMPHNNSYVGGVVSIIQSYLANKELFEKEGYQLEIFDYQPDEKWEKYSSKLKNIAYIFQQKKALSAKLKEERDLIINIHTSREFLFLKDILLAKMVKKKFNCPVVMTIHVGDINTVFNRIQKLQKYIISCINSYVDKVVFLSKKIEKQFIDAGLHRDKCEVLYNFHDMTPICNNHILKKTAKIHLIYVGAIHREKGILELLTALNNIKDIDFHLDLCGKLTDASIENEVNEFIEKLGEKVTLCGYVSGERKTALFNRADILLLPSYHEGMPLVILEGLSQGCALIATKVGATPEVLNSDNVIWTEIGNYRDIEAAIRKLYDSPSTLEKMQADNQALSSKYTLESNIAMLCKIFSAIK